MGDNRKSGTEASSSPALGIAHVETWDKSLRPSVLQAPQETGHTPSIVDIL